MGDAEGRTERGRGDDAGEPDRPSPSASPWEWVVAGLGAILVFASVGYMLHEALSEPGSPPQIEVTVDTVVATPYGYVVEFEARNHGQRTAAGVVVEGELEADTGSVEKAQVTLSFVPAGAHRGGGLLFTRDPRRHRLHLRALGYDRP